MFRIIILIGYLISLQIFADDKNLGFLMNQKYVCLNEGAIINEEIKPIVSQEEALKYPTRIFIDDNNILHTDGIIKNLNHIEKTMYGDANTKIILMVENDRRYIINISKQTNNIPMLFSCIETNNWTLVK